MSNVESIKIPWQSQTSHNAGAKTKVPMVAWFLGNNEGLKGGIEMKNLSKIWLRRLYDFSKRVLTTNSVCYQFSGKVSKCWTKHLPFYLFIITMVISLFAAPLHNSPISAYEEVENPIISAVVPKPCLLEEDTVTASKKTSSLHNSPISVYEKVENPIISTVVPKPCLLDEDTVTASKKTSPLHIKDGNRFHPYIFQAAKRYQVEAALIKAIIMAESGYNPKAISEKGAKGLMQLMPKTAKALGVQDIFSPEENVNGGVKYFKQLMNQFNGDIELALAAYNAGSGNVKRYNGIPPFKTTHFYIKKVIKYHQYYKK